MEHIEIPTGEIPVIPVTLDDKARNQLEEYIDTELARMESDRASFDKACGIWTRQYLGRLEKSEPGEAKIDMPLTGKILNQNSARVVNTVFVSPNVFVVEPKKPLRERDAKVYEDVLDSIIKRRTARFRRFARSWWRQAQLYGIGVAKIGFTREYANVLRARAAQDVLANPAIQPQTIAVFANSTAMVEERIMLSAGAFPEVVQIQDFLFPWYASDTKRVPWIGDQAYYSPAEIRVLERDNVWPAGTLQKLGDPRAAQPKRLDEQNPPNGEGKYFKVAELYMSRDVDGDGYEEEIICWFDRDSRKLIHVVYNWLEECRIPYEFCHYEERLDRIVGTSLAFMLEPLHRARSAVLRQRLDSATRSNEILLLVRTGSDLATKFKDGLRTGCVETTASLAQDSQDMREIRLSGPFPNLAELENDIEREALQIGSLSLYNLGEEKVDRPTAFGQQAMIQQGQVPINEIVDSFVESLAGVAVQMIARYKQFYQRGYPMIDATGGVLQLKLMPWPEGTINENVIIRTTVSSATMNRELRKQQKAMILDKFPQFVEVIMGLASAAAAPQNPAGPAAQKILDAYTNILTDVMSDYDIGQGMNVVPDVRKEVDATKALLTSVQQVLQQAQAGQLGPEQQPAGQPVPPEGVGQPGDGLPPNPQPSGTPPVG